MLIHVYPLEVNYQETLSSVRLPDRIKGVHYEEIPAKVFFSPHSSPRGKGEDDEEM